ncbi:FtsW/RodA/SpoVE family cell cycle protein [Bacillus testis]|uniref:FtsW/RodA/SpoVE family cell cycle protein n=1 Tax=Bacillus testis TaxID=1622072 RepID=UPI00067F254D|nr:FtsW/RodA/SpoVE family cell cycle protein [Bacillus testis]
MFKKIARSYDYSLIGSIILLSLFGLVMIYSASSVIGPERYGVESDYFFQKQRIHLILGFILFAFFAFLPYKLYQTKKVLQTIFFGSVAVLALLFVIGHTSNNAQSWLKIGGMVIQPSEFIKLGMIIYLSAVYAKKQSYINNFNLAVMPPIIFLGAVCSLIVMQPDFGTALIIFLIATTVILSCGMGMKNIMKLVGILLALGLLISPLVLIKKDSIFTDNRMGRINSFLNPFEYEKGEGYQLVNSYIAIGSGGVTGKGLGDSIQKYGYLPEPHTDFIMAIISEELGIFGVGFVLLSLGFIVMKGYRIAGKCHDPFGSLLAIGITSMIGIQSFINLGGLTGLIPITGVPLPFVSYGGSSIFLLAISMGVLVNVSMFTKYENNYKYRIQETVTPTGEELPGSKRFSVK